MGNCPLTRKSHTRDPDRSGGVGSESNNNAGINERTAAKTPAEVERQSNIKIVGNEKVR